MKYWKILTTLITLSMFASVFVVLDTLAADSIPSEPVAEFIWIDDDGSVWSDNDTDGVIPYIPSIEQIPLIVQFQIVNNGSYFGETNLYEAMENIVLMGNALFTGSLDKIPGVHFTQNTTWNVPVIPTMDVCGGIITIEAYAWDNIVSESLLIGGDNYVTNGSIVTITPNEFPIGLNQTFITQVKDADGIPYKFADVYLYYIGETGEGIGLADQKPITDYEIDYVTGGTTDGEYVLTMNTIQQTNGQLLAGFTDIKTPRDIIVYVDAQNAGKGYAKIEMKQQEPMVEIEIERGIGLGVTVFIRNIGEVEASNIEYTLSVKGGIFNFINKKFEDVIPRLETGNKMTIHIPVFGLGVVEIEAISDTVNDIAFGFVVGQTVIIPRIFL